MVMDLSVAFTIASAGKLDIIARRISRRPSGDRWMRVPGSPIKGVPGDTMLSVLDALFSDFEE
jgi:hypothetical protein